MQHSKQRLLHVVLRKRLHAKSFTKRCLGCILRTICRLLRTVTSTSTSTSTTKASKLHWRNEHSWHHLLEVV